MSKLLKMAMRHKVLSDCGNHVAVALDVLTGMNLPVGTTFRVMIDFETD